jgi:plastocyanin
VDKTTRAAFQLRWEWEGLTFCRRLSLPYVYGLICYNEYMSRPIAIIVGVVVIVILVFALLGLGSGAPVAQAPNLPSSGEEGNITPPQSSPQLRGGGATTPPPVSADASAGGSAPLLKEEREITITYTDEGFSPSMVTVKKGTKVTFTNASSKLFWPASGPHPEHTGYPEKGSCGGSAFDACTALGPGKSWSLVFSVPGEWKYHDHVNAGKRGTVVVE